MILQRLRNETSLNHSAIESQMPLLDPDMSLDTYRQLLTRFLGYYAPLEALLQTKIENYWPGKDYVCTEREKVPHLKKDLQVLGESTLQEYCTKLVQIETPAQVLGCLYVIEGATLGGQIISKHLLGNLGLGPDSGAAFFNGYGANSGSRWQSFRSFLTSSAEPISQDDEIVVSANETFRTLAAWLFPKSSIEPHSSKPRELPGVHQKVHHIASIGTLYSSRRAPNNLAKVASTNE